MATTERFQAYAAWLKEQRCFISFDDDTSRHEWLVVPHVFCPNVAEPIDESNWSALQALLAAADQTGETYELQQFNHWATPYDRYIVAPDSAAHLAMTEAMARLEEYSILDENDLSERECEAQYESVLQELQCMTLEQDGLELPPEALIELASEICSNANDSECMDRDDVKRALAKLPAHWVECIDDDTWRPEAETVPVDDLGEESPE